MVRITKSLFKFFSIISFRYFLYISFTYIFVSSISMESRKEEGRKTPCFFNTKTYIYFYVGKQEWNCLYKSKKKKKKKGQITAMEQLRWLTIVNARGFIPLTDTFKRERYITNHIVQRGPIFALSRDKRYAKYILNGESMCFDGRTSSLVARSFGRRSYCFSARNFLRHPLKSNCRSDLEHTITRPCHDHRS